MDIISPGLSSQGKIRRKFFDRKLLLQGDLRDRSFFNNPTRVSEKAGPAAEDFFLSETKSEGYVNTWDSFQMQSDESVGIRIVISAPHPRPNTTHREA